MEPALIKASRLKLRLKRDHLFNSMLSFAQMGFNLLRVLPGEVADVMTGIGGGGGLTLLSTNTTGTIQVNHEKYWCNIRQTLYMY